MNFVFVFLERYRKFQIANYPPINASVFMSNKDSLKYNRYTIIPK